MASQLASQCFSRLSAALSTSNCNRASRCLFWPRKRQHQQSFQFEVASRRKAQYHDLQDQLGCLKTSSFIPSRVLVAAAAAAAATTAGMFFGEEEKSQILSMNSTRICYCDTVISTSDKKEENEEDFKSVANKRQQQQLSDMTIPAENHHQQQQQEQTEKQQQQDHNVMVDEYVKSLMKDQELVMLPLGLGKSSPHIMDMFGLNRALVEEAISYFQSTIKSWNNPSYQGHVAGHPIVYHYYTYYNRNIIGQEGDEKNVGPTSSSSSSSTVQQQQQDNSSPSISIPYYHLVHNPEYALPWELLSVVADTLLEDPRVAPNIFPKSLERLVMMNVLHVLTCILMDLVLSSSISINNGGFQMTWKYDETKQQEYVQYLISSNKLQEYVKSALQQIDFDVVEEQASNAVKGQQMTIYGEESLYAMTYKIMLIMFWMFSVDAECRFIGTSVKQTFVKPPKIVDV